MSSMLWVSYSTICYCYQPVPRGLLSSGPVPCIDVCMFCKQLVKSIYSIAFIWFSLKYTFSNIMMFWYCTVNKECKVTSKMLLGKKNGSK